MDPLSKLALIGGAAEPTSEDPLAAAVLERLATTPVERRVLLAAGARAVARAAAYVPRTLPEPPPAAERRDRPTLGPRLADAIAEMLDGPDELLPEALARAGERELPPRLVPRALAVTDDALRRVLRPHLGARARFVAQFEPSFGWLLRGEGATMAELAAAFDEGTSDAREEALTAARALEPAVARGWVEQAFARERAELRATFVAALATGLSDADEPFLERALDDRSAQVREAARVLLARLPRSAYVQRMLARASLEPPRTVDDAAIRDGLLPNAKRAEWLERIVAAVPPSHWPRTFFAEARSSDFTDALFAGLVVAASTARDVSWLDALFELLRAGDDEYALLTVLEAMPVERRVERLRSLISMPNADISIAHALATLPGPWPDALAGEWIAAVTTRAGAGASYGDPWVASLAVGARSIPYASFSTLGDVLTRMADQKLWRAAADEASEILRLRSVAYEEVT